MNNLVISLNTPSVIGVYCSKKYLPVLGINIGDIAIVYYIRYNKVKKNDETIFRMYV